MLIENHETVQKAKDSHQKLAGMLGLVLAKQDEAYKRQIWNSVLLILNLVATTTVAWLVIH